MDPSTMEGFEISLLKNGGWLLALGRERSGLGEKQTDVHGEAE